MIGANGREDVQEVQMLWETGDVSTDSFEFLAKEIPVELAVYAKANNLLEEKRMESIQEISKTRLHHQTIATFLRVVAMNEKVKNGRLNNGTPDKDQPIWEQVDSFVYLRKDGEVGHNGDKLWKEHEIILRDEMGEPRLDEDEGNE